MKDKETLEEAAVKWIRQPKLISEKESFIAGAKWQAERMYTLDEMEEMYNYGYNNYLPYEQAIEKFKKK